MGLKTLCIYLYIMSLKQNRKRTKIFYAFLSFLHKVQNLSYVHHRDLDKRIKKGGPSAVRGLMSSGEDFRMSRGRSEETEWKLFWLLSQVAFSIKN